MKPTLKEFTGYINQFKETEDLLDELASAYSSLSGDFKASAMNVHGELVLDLLMRLMNDESHDILYFIYDLEYGAKWKKGMITDKDGKDVKMKTVRDLYDYLCKNSNTGK